MKKSLLKKLVTQALEEVMAESNKKPSKGTNKLTRSEKFLINEELKRKTQNLPKNRKKRHKQGIIRQLKELHSFLLEQKKQKKSFKEAINNAQTNPKRFRSLKGLLKEQQRRKQGDNTLSQAYQDIPKKFDNNFANNVLGLDKPIPGTGVSGLDAIELEPDKTGDPGTGDPDGIVLGGPVECPCASNYNNDGVNNCPNYGSITIFESGYCDEPDSTNIISDAFICCSSSNPYMNDMLNDVVLNSAGLGGDIMMAFDGYCYNPNEPDGGNETSTYDSAGYPTGWASGYQFIFEDFNTAWSQQDNTSPDNGLEGYIEDGVLDTFSSTWMPGDGTYPGSDGYGDTNNPYIGDYSNPNSICNQYGCPHPEGIELDGFGGTTGIEVGPGCPDDSGNIIAIGDEGWYDCCLFAGCGASGTIPIANDLTTITAAGFPDIVLDESQDWTYDDGNQCTDFSAPCTNETIEINGFDYETDLSGIEGNATSNIVLSAYPDAGYISLYDGDPVYLEDPGCIVPVCANTDLIGLVDALGAPLTTSYVLEEGYYTTYTVVNDPSFCYIEGCTSADFANSIGEGGAGLYTLNELLEPVAITEATHPSLFVAEAYYVTQVNDASVADGGMCANPEDDWVEASCYSEGGGTMDPEDSTPGAPGGFNCDCLLAAIADTYPNEQILFGNDISTEEGFCATCAAGAADGAPPPLQNFVNIPQNSPLCYCCTYEETTTGCTNELSQTNYIQNIDPEDTDTYVDGPIESDNDMCLFQYCMYGPEDQGMGLPWPANWVCYDYPELCITTTYYGESNQNCAEAGVTYEELTASTAAGEPLCAEDFTNYTQDSSWENVGCMYAQVGCLDGGTTNGQGFYDQPEPATNFFNPPVAWGSAADNPLYIPLPCQEGNFDGDCIEGQEDNPYGCCCVYNFGCTDPTAINYNPDADQDDGSCVPEIGGCTYPGMSNYDPTANTDDGSCFYNGCIDSGYWLNPEQVEGGGDNPSPWGNFVCLDTEEVTDNTEGSDTFGLTMTVGEWLCDCGGSNPCDAWSNPNPMYGAFTDTEQSAYNQEQGSWEPTNNYSGPGDIVGSCSGLNQPSCGTESYVFFDGETDVTVFVDNYNPYASEPDGSCEIVGCTDPNATNYFCTQNPDLCIGNEIDPNISANGITIGIPVGVTADQDENFNMDNPCIYDVGYDCLTYYDTEEGQEPGCNQNLLGGGAYGSLEECEQNCRNCSQVDARMCNGTEETQFPCLQIDGVDGAPATGGYIVGDFFQLDPNAEDPNVVYVDDATTTTTQDVSFIDDRPRGDDRELKGDIWEVINIENYIVEGTEPPYDLATAAECIPPVFGCTDPNASNYNPDATEDDGSCEYAKECVDIVATQCNIYDQQNCLDPISGFTYPGPPIEYEVTFECVTINGEIPTTSDYLFAEGMDCNIPHDCYPPPNPTDDPNWVMDDDITSCSDLNPAWGPSGGGNGKFMYCANGFNWTGNSSQMAGICGACDPSEEPATTPGVYSGPITGTMNYGFKLSNGNCCIFNQYPGGLTYFYNYKGCAWQPDLDAPANLSDNWGSANSCQYQDPSGDPPYADACMNAPFNMTGGYTWVVGACQDCDEVDGFCINECPPAVDAAGCPAEEGSMEINLPCNGDGNNLGCGTGAVSEDVKTSIKKLLNEFDPGGGDGGDGDGGDGWEPFEGCDGVDWNYNYTGAWDIISVSEPYVGEPTDYPPATGCNDEWPQQDQEWWGEETDLDNLDPGWVDDVVTGMTQESKIIKESKNLRKSLMNFFKK